MVGEGGGEGSHKCEGMGRGEKVFLEFGSRSIIMYNSKWEQHFLFVLYTNATLLSNHVSASQELQPAL